MPMTLIHQDVIRTARQRLPGIAGEAPTTAFAAAATLGAVALVLLSGYLPGTEPRGVALAVSTYGASAALAGWYLDRSYPHARLGLGNLTTLSRLVLVCALVALLLPPAGGGWVVFVLAACTLALDGVDGWLARRQGLVSGFGARFDMEVDSAFALVLAVHAALGSAAGALTLLLGLPRYAFAAASLLFPWLRRDLPERVSRKAVCVLQLGSLIALQAPALPASIAVALAVVASLALVWSFTIDVLWLRRARA